MGRGCNLLLGSAEQLLLLLHALLIFYASVQFNTASASELIIHQTRLFTTRQKWRVQRVATVDEWDQADFEGYWFECYKNNVLPNQSYVNWERLDSDVDITDGRIEHNGVTRLEIQPSDVLSSIGYYVCIEADNESNREYLNITNQNPGLVVESDTVEALAGSDVNLTVYISSATSNSMLTLLQWRGPPYDNEGEPTLILEEPPDVQELPVTPRTLTLMNVDCSRAGTYNFTVYVDSAGQNVKGDIAMDLHILVPVNIISSPSSSITINEWKEISLVCTADGSHPITLTWSRDDTALTNIDVRIDEETNTVTNTLIFSAIRYDDSGTYQCTASNSLTTISSNDTTHVIINVTPTLLIQSDDNLHGNTLLASLGTSLVVKCFGSGNLAWSTIDGVPITSDNTEPIYITNNPAQSSISLVIHSLDMTEAYSCTSDLVPGLEESIFITIEDQLAVFIMEDEIFAQNGDTVIIQASIHSLTDINSILWYRNQTLLEAESNERYDVTIGDIMTTLTITDFQNEDVGMYVVMVTNSDDSSANDSTVIMFPEPTSAVMDPEELIVDVGDRVKAVCMGDGSGLLEIKWSLENSDDDETLPDGIQTEGSILSIAMATLSHNNVYICTVSSQFSMSDATFDLKVFDPLIVEIAYINDFSTKHILSFHHGNGIVPSFKCVVNGSQNVSLTWQLSSGDPLPSGTLLVDNGQKLTWSHRLEYTDSDVYECLVVDLNTGRERSASVDMIIIHDPVLDTIFPAPEISTGSSLAQFIIPLEFTGTVLTCSGFAWPLPSVEWTKNGGALPRGVTAEEIVLPDKGIVVSDLTFSSEFSIVDAGNYQCKVLSTNDDGEMMSQLVELKQGPSTAEGSEYMCKSILSDSTLFQVRVFTNDCDKWNDDRSEIAEDFENLIIRVVASLCGEECNITNGIITISTLECSTFIQGGVVFRGSIQTESAKQTEAAFCALSQWQRSGSLVSIGMYRYLVDSQCTLQIDSYQDEECVEATAEQELDVMMILLIGIPVVAIVSVVGVVITIVVLGINIHHSGPPRVGVTSNIHPPRISSENVPNKTDHYGPPRTTHNIPQQHTNSFHHMKQQLISSV